MASGHDVGGNPEAARLVVVSAPGAARPGRRARAPLLLPGMLALLAALWGGLLRLGWQLPVPPTPLAAFHGPLMVAGFLGTVIGMERAVALGGGWAYLAPLASGLGALALVAGSPGGSGPLLTTAGSLGLVLLFVAILFRQTAPFTVVMALGALAWLAAQIFWLRGWPTYRVAPWWAAFLVLTIAGERLELSRVVPVSVAARAAFLGAVALLLAGLALTVADFDAGVRAVGAALLALAVWLALQDVARRTVHRPGLTRFIAVCLLSGYAWLAVGGVLALVHGGVAAGGPYDAMLHALFLGFVFAMIFGHAPIILPAVLGVAVGFRPSFYAHLALLHATLVLRVAGDLLGWLPGRQWGGLLNVVALLLFAANTAWGVLRPPPTARP